MFQTRSSRGQHRLTTRRMDTTLRPVIHRPTSPWILSSDLNIRLQTFLLTAPGLPPVVPRLPSLLNPLRPYHNQIRVRRRPLTTRYRLLAMLPSLPCPLQTFLVVRRANSAGQNFPAATTPNRRHLLPSCIKSRRCLRYLPTCQRNSNTLRS